LRMEHLKPEKLIGMGGVGPAGNANTCNPLQLRIESDGNTRECFELLHRPIQYVTAITE
jgi:hypothetical protein